MNDLPPPVRDGVGASTVQLPAGPWPRLLDFLVERFPEIPAATWCSRLERGQVLDSAGRPLSADSPCTPGSRVHYFRELETEPSIPFEAEILYRDAQLLVVDKPHFLPVVPAGRFLQETLLVRLRRALGNDALAPLHRIDRGTAGLVLFSLDPASRGRYQSLFLRREVQKTYEALAPALPPDRFPLTHRSRLVEGEPFFRMQESDGPANSQTRVEIAAGHGELSLYRLQPVTGRKHQLRVHMAALGAPILNDDFYPELRPVADDDFSKPLQLLARAIRFTDPLSGEDRQFESRRRLRVPTA